MQSDSEAINIETNVSQSSLMTTGVTLSTGDVMILVSTPKQESSDAGSGILQQGTLDYNYTEIL